MTNSRSLSPVPPDQWPESLSHIIDDMAGLPLNVHGLMAHNPALLNAWWTFRNHSVAGGSLGPRRAELVILRVSVHLRSWYEWASHVERALSCGVTIQEVNRVKSGAQGWSEEDALLLEAVDQLITNQVIDMPTLSLLERQFDDAQIMDIVAIHGMYVILGCMINIWELQLDEHVENALPPGESQVGFETQLPRLKEAK